MVHRGRPLVLGWYAFLAWNVVLFHGLAALDGQVPARRLAVAASVTLATSLLIQLALLVRAHVLYVRSRGVRAAVNRRTGEVLPRNGEAARARRPGLAAPSTR